jgi:tight adherence protein B
MSVIVALVAAYGAFLVWTGVFMGWRGFGPGPAMLRLPGAGSGLAARRLLGSAGVPARELAGAVVLLGILGFAVGLAIFGAALPALAAGGLAAGVPFGAYRTRAERRMSDARAAWPRMIEAMRVQIGALGRSIPQALFEAGREGPAELQGAFAAAEREWLVSTDFARTVAVLKDALADATADAACETLLVAHEVGGADVDKRLAALVEDRIADIQARRDALAHQAGARFARRFVAVVPIGMALAGISIGTGRQAFGTPLGQILALIGLAAMAGCWAWAGRLMRIPDTERVLR